jgi:hypothetical protein
MDSGSSEDDPLFIPKKQFVAVKKGTFDDSEEDEPPKKPQAKPVTKKATMDSDSGEEIFSAK